MAEKMRVHILAKELKVPSKTIVEKCLAEGVTVVKNHMSTLSAGLHATILEWFSDGAHDGAVETTGRVDLDSVRVKEPAKPKLSAKMKAALGTDDGDSGDGDSGGSVALAEPDAVGAPGVDEAIQDPGSLSAAAVTSTSTAAEVPADSAEPASPAGDVPAEGAIGAAALAGGAAESVSEAPAVGDAPSSVAGVADASETSADGLGVGKPGLAGTIPKGPVTPAGPQHVPTPAKLQGPRVVRYEAPDYDARPPSRAPTTPRPPLKPGEAPPPPAPARGPARGTGDKATDRRRGRINPRRQASTLAEAGERLAEWRDLDLAERKERLAGATGRRMVRRRSVQSGSGKGHVFEAGPKTKATVHEPIQMKEFCSETGLSFMQLVRILRVEHNIAANINSCLPTEAATLLALNFGIELEVIPLKTKLEELREEFADRTRDKLELRPPIVAMLGHVDHGKTSLLDVIRKSQVADGEDGGITQHISSYHVDSSHGPVTFLDTPGHEAFSAMRARGAQITDIVVLVVAADDGVMPQTIEAINHAKAADVPVVVALNKSDLGDVNNVKIYGQLAEHGLTPSGDWGGHIDVMPTSAKTGDGVKELVEHLADLSSVLELEADRSVPCCGTVIEARTKTGVGPVVTVLVREGTMRVGNFVVCGNAAGKIKALINDRGARIDEAGPSTPVEVWGLDDVPAAGDELYQVATLQRAKDIAGETKQGRVAEGRTQIRRASSLQEMLKRRDTEEVPELNVIIKADVDGSVVALKQMLERLPTDEVRLAIRHAGVGAVNDSDVILAAACKGIIVAFRVDTSVGAKRLADVHGVEVRTYLVIYQACDEIKKALEGLLAPLETVETRGTIEIREVFHLSRKGGVIAGSYVTQGVVDRSQLVKLTRNGVIVREGVKISSLRRFKDDVKEVRAGLECGIRLEGFDDLHAGDIIETYEIVKTARTL